MSTAKEQLLETAKLRFSNLEREALAEVERLLNSGAIDPEDCHAGILFGVAVENLADGWLRMSRKTKTYRNLKKF